MRHLETRGFRARTQRGATTLVTTAFLAVALGGLSLMLYQEGQATRGALARDEGGVRALEIAETALLRAELEVCSMTDPAGDGLGNLSGNAGGGSYAVRAVRDAVLTDRWTLVATGRHGLSSRRLEETIRRVEPDRFQDVLFGQGGATLSGNVQTDAFDSRRGSYESQAVNFDAEGRYASEGGSIGSNNGSITLSGNVLVRGNAVPGPLDRTEISGSVRVTGSTTPRARVVDVAPTSFEAFQAAYAANDNGNWIVGGGSVDYVEAQRELKLSGNALLTMPGGTYFFSKLKLSGGSTIEFAGPAAVYVTGVLDLSGGSTNNLTRVPANLKVFVHPYDLPPGFAPSDAEVKLSGGSGAYMDLYAPEAKFTMSAGDFYGRAVVREFTLSGNSFLHYDTALGGGGRMATIERLAWREPSLPRR